MAVQYAAARCPSNKAKLLKKLPLATFNKQTFKICPEISLNASKQLTELYKKKQLVPVNNLQKSWGLKKGL
jgi:hypothetical protein